MARRQARPAEVPDRDAFGLVDRDLRQLLESFPGVIWVTDRELRASAVFGADLEALGIRPDELIGKSVAEFLGSDEPDLPPLAAHRRALQGEGASYRQAFGDQIREGRVEPLRDATGLIVGAVGMSIDMTDLQAAEVALRQSDALIRAVVEAALDAVIIIDAVGAILEFNPAAEAMFGHARETVVGEQLVELVIPPSLRDAHRRGFERYAATGESVILGKRLQLSAIRADGTEFPIELAITRVPIAGSPVFAGSIRDISKRVAAEEALRRSEESYRLLFELHPSPMWVYDAQTLRFLAVNEAATASYGYSHDEFLTMTIDEIRPADDASVIRGLANGPERGLVDAGIWRHRRKDGTLIDVQVVSNAIDFEDRPARLVLAQDVTEQRRLEDQLRQAQKMEAIGNLAGGIAHDFNNILMVIRTSAALMLRRLADDESRRNLARIDSAAERAAGLTHQLLAFSRQQVLRPEITDVNDVVRETLELVHRTIGEDVEIVCELEPGLQPILVDRGQLGQVLLNLVVNARDAMADGGRLTITTANVLLDEGYAFEHAEVEQGPYVVLQVTDSGAGMDEATQARVFDPFFTTKEEGTGLGLATVYGIVKQSNGHIWLYSEPDVGTTFKIYFPAAAMAVESPAVPPDVASLHGDETILLAEDDDDVRLVIADALRSYGYTVLAAGDGPAAIELARREEAIDLLVTDVVMPGMSGRELVERLSADRPALRVLYTSGYPADAVLRRGIAQARAPYIEKPYVPDDLARKVREVLDT